MALQAKVLKDVGAMLKADPALSPLVAAAYALGAAMGQGDSILGATDSTSTEQLAAAKPSTVETVGADGRSAEDTTFLQENYPKNLESVTPEWISVLLRAKIKSMSIKKKLEAGVTGDAAIFNLTYDAGSWGPKSVVLKYAKDNEQSRQLAQDSQMYEKEVMMYAQLHPVISQVLPIPTVYGTFVDADKPNEFFCIAMEDLSIDYNPMDQIAGISLDDAKRLAPLVAKLHAQFWKSEVLKNDTICAGDPSKCNIWFHGWLDMVIADPHQIDIMYNHLLTNDKMTSKVDWFPTDNHKSMVRLWKAHGKELNAEFYRILATRPFTLTHGDMRADNLFAHKPEIGSGFQFIDWQTFGAAPPGVEMVQLFSGSFTKLEDLEQLDSVLEIYLKVLYERCPEAKEYTLEMLKEDWTITLTMLYIGLANPFAPFFEVLPSEHPLWVLFTTAFPRYVKLSCVLDIAGYTMRTAAALGLELDPGVLFMDNELKAAPEEAVSDALSRMDSVSATIPPENTGVVADAGMFALVKQNSFDTAHNY